MPTIAKNEGRQLETGAQSISTSTMYGQHWWQGFGNGPLSSGENTRDPTSQATNQSQGNGGDVPKETDINVASQPGLNGSNNQEQQHPKSLASTTAPVMGECLGTNPQMELVGHSIMLSAYPYADAQYGGVLTYGAPVHPNFYGIHQNRMPLPLQMEEEPVYVNAKQYHGILRRRQMRAKAELEKKVIKVRKPYLHESRHQHAMRRARGSGGRFLNSKKAEGNATSSSEGQTKLATAAPAQSGNSSGSEPTSCDGNSGQQAGSSFGRDTHENRTFPNSSSKFHGLMSSYYHSLGSQPGRGRIDHGNWSFLEGQAPSGSATN